MDHLLDLLKMLSNSQNEMRVKANKALEGVGPIEQIEAGQEVCWALRELDWLGKRLGEMAETYAAKVGDVDEFVASLRKNAGEAALTAAIEAGEILKKEEHDALLAAAKDEGKTEAEEAFRAEREKAELAARKRKELEGKVGVIAASVIADEDLVAEDADKRVDLFTARAKQLEEKGFKASEFEGAFKDLLAAPLDDEGTKTFESRLGSYAPLLARRPAAPSKPGQSFAASRTGATDDDGAPEGEPKKRMRF